MESVPTDTPTALYHLYGSADLVLYIGVSAEPEARLRQHESDKPWWPEVIRHSIEWHPSRAAALTAEASAIHIERPLYNLNGVTPRLRSRTAAPEVPVWPASDLHQMAGQLGEILSRRDLSHAHARLRALNLLLRGRDELPHGNELGVLAGWCGTSMREAYRALALERDGWPDGWEADRAG